MSLEAPFAQLFQLPGGCVLPTQGLQVSLAYWVSAVPGFLPWSSRAAGTLSASPALPGQLACPTTRQVVLSVALELPPHRAGLSLDGWLAGPSVGHSVGDRSLG